MHVQKDILHLRKAILLELKILRQSILGSIVVSISACHAEDPGSIPGRGVHFFFCFSLLSFYSKYSRVKARVHDTQSVCISDGFLSRQNSVITSFLVMWCVQAGFEQVSFCTTPPQLYALRHFPPQICTKYDVITEFLCDRHP